MCKAHYHHVIREIARSSHAGLFVGLLARLRLRLHLHFLFLAGLGADQVRQAAEWTSGAALIRASFSRFFL